MPRGRPTPAPAILLLLGRRRLKVDGPGRPPPAASHRPAIGGEGFSSIALHGAGVGPRPVAGPCTDRDDDFDLAAALRCTVGTILATSSSRRSGVRTRRPPRRLKPSSLGDHRGAAARPLPWACVRSVAQLRCRGAGERDRHVRRGPMTAVNHVVEGRARVPPASLTGPLPIFCAWRSRSSVASPVQPLPRCSSPVRSSTSSARCCARLLDAAQRPQGGRLPKHGRRPTASADHDFEPPTSRRNAGPAGTAARGAALVPHAVVVGGEDVKAIAPRPGHSRVERHARPPARPRPNPGRSFRAGSGTAPARGTSRLVAV